MSTGQLVAVLAAVLSGLLTAAAAGPVLRRLPEPHPDDIPADETKTRYADLPTPAFLLTCGLLSAVATALAWSTLPAAAQPAWLVLATVGLLTAAVDARTTWVPATLAHVGWAAMAVALAVGATLGGGWPLLGRALAGAALCLGLLAVVRRAGPRLLSRLLRRPVAPGGFGEGDLWFVPLLGAAAGTVSATGAVWALLLGSLVGVAHPMALRALGREGEAYPYLPSLLAGGYLYLLVVRLLGAL